MRNTRRAERAVDRDVAPRTGHVPGRSPCMGATSIVWRRNACPDGRPGAVVAGSEAQRLLPDHSPAGTPPAATATLATSASASVSVSAEGSRRTASIAGPMPERHRSRCLAARRWPSTDDAVQQRHAASVSTNTAPPCTALDAVSEAPSRCAIVCEIERPRPSPFSLVVKNGSKMRCR